MNIVLEVLYRNMLSEGRENHSRTTKQYFGREFSGSRAFQQALNQPPTSAALTTTSRDANTNTLDEFLASQSIPGAIFTRFLKISDE
uniref:Uncharacterized protein n=1 Tax=Caenorhabditis japonica TaxID=281687 RepID=A0A8R1IZ94_CAEJA